MLKLTNEQGDFLEVVVEQKARVPAQQPDEESGTSSDSESPKRRGVSPDQTRETDDALIEARLEIQSLICIYSRAPKRLLP